MRSFAFAVIAAISNAARVHEFFAENNFICELCKTVVDHASKGNDAELDAIYEQFPKLQERVNFFADKAELVNLAEPLQTCQNIQLCSEDNIMDLLKGHDWSPFDRSIDTLVGRLRRKIEADPDNPRLIKTVRGVGYVFAADVESN